MEVNFWTYFLVIQIQLALFVEGQKGAKSKYLVAYIVNTGRKHFSFLRIQSENIPNFVGPRVQPDDTSANTELTDELLNKPLDFLTKPDAVSKDYFLPPVFTNNEETDDPEDDDDNLYTDYDYETKESNYKDSPDRVQVKNNDHQEHAVDDKIPLHTAKDNLPIFLLEPENTYVVKSKPATLKCRAANALEVSKYSSFYLLF